MNRPYTATLPRYQLLERSAILVPGDTVWRTCEANRVAVLKDAAEYFGAVRDALRVAERQVQIIGWDIHSETSLVGPSGRAEDGLPIALAPFLKALLRAKPELRIDILIWDFAALYAAEREWNSADKLISGTGGRVRFCLDSRLPLGSAQHQKIVVIDNAVGFVGGLDLTIRRWDTGDHLVDHACRRGPDGKSYSPFHDVQCMVDGEAAKALGELATARWISAGCHAEAFEPVHGEHWPASVPVDARDMRAGIARTELGVRGRPGVREVARLFERSIKAANRFIYVENQFTSSADITRTLARRMIEVPSLRVLIVAPKMHSSWLETQAMQGGRGAFIGPLVSAGVMDRIRILYPLARGSHSSSAVMVHSKVMIVDDDLLRIGSANLNNRSMGADSECDLVFEATCEDHRDFIRTLRRKLIGHFCALAPDQIAAEESELFAFLDGLSASDRRVVLLPIDPKHVSLRAMTEIVQPIADPRQPLNLERAARRMWTIKTGLAVAGIVTSLIGLALAWRYTSLSNYADAGLISGIISRQSHSAFAPLLAIAAFVLGGLVVFPVIVLIAATAAALGPWMGALSATAGVLLSALVLFVIGRQLGQQRLQSLLGKRALRLQSRIVGEGILAIAMIRMVPIAPFSLVNLLAGASKLRLTDFLAGTILGMLPGIITMAALGAQIGDFARNASWSSALLLGLTIVIWIAVCLGVQFLVTWLSGRRP